MDIRTDFRYAARSLARRPGFTLMATITLALGIGATAAIFSVANSVLIQSLPYPDAHELVTVWEDDVEDTGTNPGGGMSTPNLADIRNALDVFDAVAAYRTASSALSGLGAAEVIPTGEVDRDLFAVFGAEPILGRTFTADENRAEGPNAVVVSEAFWRTRLGGDLGVLGRTLMLDGESHPIVGVAPGGFEFPGSSQLWVPIQNNPEGCGRGCQLWQAVGRLADGVPLERARSELTVLAAGLEAEYPDTNTGVTLRAADLHELVVGDVRTALWVLLGAVAMVLLIACANVANLILVRGRARQAELAVRSALGASRHRLVGQLMWENVMLAGGGGVAGLLLAWWGIVALVALGPDQVPRLDEVALDGTTILFGLSMVALTVLIFGLAPALRLAAGGEAATMRQAGRGGIGERRGRRVRAAVLVAEVALSTVLLLGAGLMLRSLVRMQSVDLGIEIEDRSIFRLSLPEARYDDPDRRVQFMEQLEERLTALPGVDGVATTAALPFSNVNLVGGFMRTDQPEPEPGSYPTAAWHVMDDDALDVLGMTVRQGRGFLPTDRHGAPGVALINAAAAERYWAGEDPVGKEIEVFITAGYEEGPRTIVGVVDDFRDSVTEPGGPAVLVPWAQVAASFPHVVIRAPGAASASVLAATRDELAGLDPELPMIRPQPMEALIADQLATSAFYLLLLGLFAALAIALAAVGIYGVVAYLVVQRTREIGMRVALGARHADVVRLVVWQGLGPALLGLGMGVLGALALGRVVAGILYDVEPTDPLTYAAMATLLLAVVGAATAVPAWRAVRIPPAQTLRAD